MTRGSQLDIQECPDSRPFGSFHWRILLLGPHHRCQHATEYTCDSAAGLMQ